MNRYMKGALKTLTNYSISLLIFGIFLYVFISLTKENFNTWLPLYCFFNFALLFLMLFSDMKSIAAKEKRPQYNLNPYPIDGLLYGVLGVLPLFLLEIIYPFLVFDNEFANRVKHLALNTILGPLYGFIRLGQESPVSYILAVLTVPVTAMLGYMAGYYDIGMSRYFRKFYNSKTQNKNAKRS